MSAPSMFRYELEPRSWTRGPTLARKRSWRAHTMPASGSAAAVVRRAGSRPVCSSRVGHHAVQPPCESEAIMFVPMTPSREDRRPSTSALLSSPFHSPSIGHGGTIEGDGREPSSSRCRRAAERRRRHVGMRNSWLTRCPGRGGCGHRHWRSVSTGSTAHSSGSGPRPRTLTCRRVARADGKQPNVRRWCEQTQGRTRDDGQQCDQRNHGSSERVTRHWGLIFPLIRAYQDSVDAQRASQGLE